MGTSFRRDRHTTTSLHLLSTARSHHFIKMNSIILIASVLIGVSTAMNPCMLRPLVPKILANVDDNCGSSCNPLTGGNPEDTDRCPTNGCTIGATIAAATALSGVTLEQLAAMVPGLTMEGINAALANPEVAGGPVRAACLGFIQSIE